MKRGFQIGLTETALAIIPGAGEPAATAPGRFGEGEGA